MWPSGHSTQEPCAVEHDALSGRGPNLSLGASAYQRIISNNSYARAFNHSSREMYFWYWCHSAGIKGTMSLSPGVWSNDGRRDEASPLTGVSAL